MGFMFIDKLHVNQWSENQPVFDSNYKYHSQSSRYEAQYTKYDDDFIFVKTQRRSDAGTSPSTIYQFKQEACRKLGQHIFDYVDNPKSGVKLVRAAEDKETVSRIDIAVDIDLSVKSILTQNLKLNGNFKVNFPVFNNKTGQCTYKRWGGSDLLQICIYDKKLDLVNNYDHSRWGQAYLKKIGKKPLTRIELRLGPKYLKKIKNGNDLKFMRDNWQQIACNIFKEQCHTNNPILNKKIKKHLKFEKSINYEKETRHMKNTIKFWKDRYIRSAQMLKRMEQVFSLELLPEVPTVISEDVIDAVEKMLNEFDVDSEVKKIEKRLRFKKKWRC